VRVEEEVRWKGVGQPSAREREGGSLSLSLCVCVCVCVWLSPVACTSSPDN
jgi:hypothetical protein